MKGGILSGNVLQGVILFVRKKLIITRFHLVAMLFCAIPFLCISFLPFHYNLGVSPDSTYYIIAAGNLKIHRGFTNYYGDFINIFPPLYPALLTACSKIAGVDIAGTGLLINSIFCSLLFFVFNLLLRTVKAGIRTVIALNLVLLFSPAMQVFSMFWSEVPFIVILLSIFFLVLRNKKPSLSWPTIFLIGTLSGILFLTRFSALPFIALLTGYFILGRRVHRVERIKDLLVFLLPMVLIYLAWHFYKSSFPAAFQRREFAIHLVSFSHLKQLFHTLYTWISPFGYISSALCFLFVSILLIKNKPFLFLSTIVPVLKSDRLVIFSLASILVYISFILFTVSFIDATVPLDNRIFFPIYPFALFIIHPLLAKLFYGRIDVKRLFLFILLGAFSMGHVKNTIEYWRNTSSNGQWYTSRDWKNSAALQSLKKYKGYKIFTNGDDVAAFYSDQMKGIDSLPLVFSSVTRKQNKHFNLQMQELKRTMINEPAIILFFNNIQYRTYYPGRTQLINYFDNMKITHLEDGLIIESPKP